MRLFVDAEHDGVSRRRNVKADDIGLLLDEGGIIREFELTPAMRRQAMRFPYRLHGRGRDAGGFRHGARRPMGRLRRRR